MKEHKLTFPVAVDKDGKTWKAWDNNYWPSIYLIDKKGDVRYRWDGELGLEWRQGAGKNAEEDRGTAGREGVTALVPRFMVSPPVRRQGAEAS